MKYIEIKDLRGRNAYCRQCGAGKKKGLPIGERVVKFGTINDTGILCLGCARKLIQPIAEEFGWKKEERDHE